MNGPVAAATVDRAAPAAAAARADSPTHAARRLTTAVATSVGSLERAAQHIKAGIAGFEIDPSERLQGPLGARPPTRRAAVS